MSPSRWLIALRARWRSLVRRGAAELELDEELQFHVEQATAEHIARGTTPASARRAALLSIGGLDQRKEECREARGFGWSRAMARDAGLAFRLLRRQPAFSLVVVFTLAIGIGAPVAVFNVVNWMFLRSLPGVTASSELVTIRLMSDDLAQSGEMSFLDVETLLRGAPALRGLTGIDDIPIDVSIATDERAARRVPVMFAMANYFDVLGVAVEGRGFTSDEERLPGAPPVMVVSERLARELGGDAVVGRTMLVNGQRAQVVGIARRGFLGTRRMSPIDLWMPLAQNFVALPVGIERPAILGPRLPTMWSLIGRRDPAYALDVLQAQLSSGEKDIVAVLPPTSMRFRTQHIRVTSSHERFGEDAAALGSTLRMLLIATGLVLVLACANASNALLARSSARSAELATRLAIGATRWSLARALFIESVLLSLAAGALGVGVATIVATVLDGTPMLASLPPLERPHMDWAVAGTAAALCMVAAVAAGMAPMLAMRHTRATSAFRENNRSVSRGRRRLTQALMSVQVAISVVLLVAAALFVRSVSGQLRIDTGIERQRVLTFRLDPRRQAGDPSHSFRRGLIDRLRAIPGVRAATVAFLPPFHSGNEAQLLLRTDDTPGDVAPLRVMVNAVHAGFFDAIALPLLGGRDFVDADFALPVEQSPLILSESVARRLFGHTNVVGRFVVTSTKARRQVVGVVRDSRQRQLLADNTMDLTFQPFRVDYFTPFMTGIVSVETPEPQIWSDVRRVVAEMDPALVMFQAKSVEEGIRTQIGHKILTMRLVLVFGVVAVFIAAVGLASVLSRVLAERRRELGIRMALGATPTRVAALVARQSLVVLVTGIGVGTLATVWLTRYVESRLYGISRLDAPSFAVAIAVVIVVMIAASLPACRRAARVQPAATLKES